MDAVSLEERGAPGFLSGSHGVSGRVCVQGCQRGPSPDPGRAAAEPLRGGDAVPAELRDPPEWPEVHPADHRGAERPRQGGPAPPGPLQGGHRADRHGSV